ncbi:hypothetical protein [Succinivibrio dextrinosolvens]|nr:hypothetical protein [Succinivibrio dextrinosolvens]
MLSSDNQHIDNLSFESFGAFICSNYLMCFFFVGLGGILFMILSFICALKMYFDKISPLILDKSYKSFPFCLKTFLKKNLILSFYFCFFVFFNSFVIYQFDSLKPSATFSKENLELFIFTFLCLMVTIYFYIFIDNLNIIDEYLNTPEKPSKKNTISYL